jgi:serine/threonine-protein phosphatase 6 regulatory ankyrin repeat subunit B
MNDLDQKLHDEVMGEHVSTARLRMLVQAGANIHVRTRFGQTALHLATRSGNRGAVTALLSLGAETNVLDELGLSPIYYASFHSHHDMVRQLLPCQSNLTVPLDEDEMCGYLYAAKHGFIDLFSGENSAREAATLCDVFGTTALHFAAQHGHAEIAARLLSAGASVDAVDAMGTTPLVCAVAEEHVALIHQLLISGADLQRQDCYGRTPLHIAVRFNRPHSAQQLLLSGADMLVVDADGHTPLSMAVTSDDTTMVALLTRFLHGATTAVPRKMTQH